MKEIEKKMADYYDQHFTEFGIEPKGLGWKNKEAQIVRFEQLEKLFKVKSNFSVNDLGCGLGDLFSFLTDRGFTDFQYRGYDLLDTMVEKALDRFKTEGNATFFKIDHANQLKPADYSIASGIFNLKYETPEYEWLNFILETLHFMDKNSSKGFAFNMLTRYSDKEYMQEILYYTDPLFIFDYCKRNYSRNVALLHDYEEYDFTILVRK